MKPENLELLKNHCHTVARYGTETSIHGLFRFIMDLPLDEWPKTMLATTLISVGLTPKELNTEAFR